MADTSNLINKEEFLQLIMDHIPQYIFWKDTESRLLGCNVNFANAAGFEGPKDIIGKTDYDLPWTKEESDQFVRLDKRVMESGRKILNLEEKQTRKDGKARWVRTNKIPLYDERGKVIGLLGTFEDITEKKELELRLIKKSEELMKSNEALRVLNNELVKLNSDLEQYTYAASHDLKEPIRTIGSFITLLRRRYKEELDDTALEYINFALEGCERMSKLINDTLKYATLGKTKEEHIVVYLKPLVEEKLKDLTYLFQESNAKIDIDLPSRKVNCNPEQIGVLFYNLISNGIKFNDSTIPYIRIGFEDRGQEWLFYISDNGIGIEQEYSEVVFKAFKKLESTRKYPSSGIGLSLCKKIVDLHNGDIWHKPGKKEGTTFFFTLPKK